jgi:Xaa-Pro dipeptidase
MINPEITEKRRRLTGLMDRLGLDGVLLRKQSNYSWYTAGRLNLVGAATELGVASILVTRDHQYILCNAIELKRIDGEDRLGEQDFEFRSYPWYDEREAGSAAEIVKGGKLGCDSAFPDATDISKELNPLRWSLTSWEIERYRELGRLASKAAEETCAAVRPGDKECQVIGRLAERLWADRVDYITVLAAADERISQLRHPIPTEKKIEKRLMLSVNARKWGLIVSLTRFVQFGKLPAELKKRYEDCVYVDSVLMANTIPGKPVLDAFTAGLAAYKEKGFEKEYELHHQGGSIGYQGRDYKVNFKSTEVVQENQGFTWNPSITGTKSEDVMLATSKGALLITRPVIYPKLRMSAGGQSFERPAILEL